MSSRPEVRWSQLRTAMLPDLLISLVDPVLIYRVAVSSLPATEALLLADVLPLIRVGIGLIRSIFLSRERELKNANLFPNTWTHLADSSRARL